MIAIAAPLTEGASTVTGMNPSALVVVGLGLLLCFAGHWLARIALAFWAGAVGYLVGLAGYVLLDQNGVGVSSTPSWVFGAIGAVVFAVLAYFFYVAAVLLTLGSIAWTVGSVVAVGLALSPSLQLVVAVSAAVVVGAWGAAFDLPRKLMVVATAVIGAVLVVAGVRTLVEGLDWLNLGSWVGGTTLPWVWFAIGVVLAAVGIFSQLRQQGEKSLRAAYSG